MNEMKAAKQREFGSTGIQRNEGHNKGQNKEKNEGQNADQAADQALDQNTDQAADQKIDQNADQNQNADRKREKRGLFQRDFTMVVIGQIISLFGNNILRFALPLYLLQQTGSARLFGIVSACSFLPMIVLSPVGGIVADRANKKNIMVILDFSTAGLILIFGAALGSLPLIPLLIATLMILYGIQGAYQPAVQASIPLLAEGENIMPANAVINQVNSLAGLLGPVIGGMIYGAWGLVPILAVGGVCFLFSAVMEIFIHIPYQKTEQQQGILAIIKEDLTESVSFIRFKKPVLAKTIALICAFNLFMSAMIIIGLPVLITQTLGMSSRMLGFSQGALAAGGLAGGILTGIFAKKLSIKKAHLLLLICAVGIVPMGLCLMFGLSSMACYLIITAMNFILMGLSTAFTIQMITFIQMETPPELIGKVISCLMAFSMCAQPVGQAMYGTLFEYFEDAPWIVVLGSAAASTVIALLSGTAFGKIGEEDKEHRKIGMNAVE